MKRFHHIVAIILCAVVTLATTGTPALVDLCCDGLNETTAAPLPQHACCTPDVPGDDDCCDPVLMLDAIDAAAVVPTVAMIPPMATWDLPPIIDRIVVRCEDMALPRMTPRHVAHHPPPDPDVLSVFLL